VSFSGDVSAAAPDGIARYALGIVAPIVVEPMVMPVRGRGVVDRFGRLNVTTSAVAVVEDVNPVEAMNPEPLMVTAVSEPLLSLADDGVTLFTVSTPRLETEKLAVKVLAPAAIPAATT